jgi:hypothetical protein
MDRLVEYEVRLSFLFTMGAGIFETLDRLTDLTSATSTSGVRQGEPREGLSEFDRILTGAMACVGVVHGIHDRAEGK